MRLEGSSRAALHALASILPATLTAAQCELTQLAPKDAQADELFGLSLALSGKRAAVAAPYVDDKGPESGAVYTWRSEGGNWYEEQKLLTPDGDDYDYFGQAVALHDDRLLIGAPWAGASGFDLGPGAAYLYEFDGLEWQFVQSVTDPAGVPGNDMGSAVALTATTLFVSSPYSGTPSWSGEVFVYEHDGVSWVQSQTLSASDASLGESFGFSIDADPLNERVLIGCPGDAANGPGAGAAYVFERQGGVWVEVVKLSNNVPMPFAQLGFDVGLAGDTALVGARTHSGAGPAAGAVVAFELQGGVWIQTQTLYAADADSGDSFGHAVDVEGDVALLSAIKDDDPHDGSGTVYLFEREGGTWLQTRKLSASDGQANDQYGQAVALSGKTALIGAWLHDGNGPESGSAYLWRVPGGACLSADVSSLSLAAGGLQTFSLRTGESYAGLDYLLLGSMSGTAPGFYINGNILPLSIDDYTIVKLLEPDEYPLENGEGLLDTEGNAVARFRVKPASSGLLAGTVMNHAFVVIELTPTLLHVVAASNAVSTLLVP